MNTILPIFVINLDSDTERLASLTAALKDEHGFELIRIPAVWGRELPALARLLLTQNGGWVARKGELGCFLSHVKAWEAVAVRGSSYCIILEDDAVPIALGRLRSLTIPPDAELVFINDRMSPGPRYADRKCIPTCLPIIESLRKLSSTGGSAGSDGYILTSEAAKKLIDAVSRDYCFGHVDGRLLRYCVTESDLLPEFDDTKLGSVIRNHHNPHRPPDWAILKSYCLDIPLVQFGKFKSSRIATNEQ